MAYIVTVDPPGDGATAELFSAESLRWGYVPNLARTFALRPDVYAAWVALNGAVKRSMPSRRYELATLAAAATLRSSYCSLAHGRILADEHLPVADVMAIAAGSTPDDMAAAERAIVEFARTAARSAAEVDERDIDRLRDSGLDDGEIFDLTLAVAARCFFSTVLDATGTRADGEFRSLPTSLRTSLTVGRPIDEVSHSR
jgi:uncharacterized peroxidase-related enzyme